jgi:hypothetical protein
LGLPENKISQVINLSITRKQGWENPIPTVIGDNLLLGVSFGMGRNTTLIIGN